VRRPIERSLSSVVRRRASLTRRSDSATRRRGQPLSPTARYRYLLGINLVGHCFAVASWFVFAQDWCWFATGEEYDAVETSNDDAKDPEGRSGVELGDVGGKGKFSEI
jgi:hypothetical protein